MINLENGDVWHLPKAELHVLSLLIEYQGKVVAKPLLESGYDDNYHLSGASVARAVFTLRAFFGPQHESLIETVKGQGYLLRHHRTRKVTKRVLPSINRRYASLIIITIIGLMIGGIVAVKSMQPKIGPIEPLSISTVTMSSGKTVEILLFSPSKTNNELLIEQGLQIQQSFADCDVSSWQSVFLSLSHDKQVLNITMQGELLGQSLIRNLKISDLRQPKQFVNRDWLKQVNICDTISAKSGQTNQRLE
ncbi:helix-turn-helix domain-containing protein [Shewanella sp. H8]|uniref:winged helix-turn-helix domain-containing protein n=1 Tax=Shewanella sp. H8 TaxID=3342676 RepID=UPI003316414D